jgi:hypothetical protein
MYAYCQGDPVNFVDPGGMAANKLGTAIGLALTIALVAVLTGTLDSYELYNATSLNIDTDGSPSAKDKAGSNWYGSDGSHGNQTAFSLGGQFLDPFLIRYVVLPASDTYNGAAQKGDIVLLFNKDNGKMTLAVIGDVKGKGYSESKHNEVSISAAWDLMENGGRDSAVNGNNSLVANVSIVYFPGTHSYIEKIGSVKGLAVVFGWTRYKYFGE